ncbi:hypothetical protein C8R48DRAFT_781110 [Suillus tomentosus]|nr:hypothetical protein C8R48DRAFT_781110 [Suillus tomentosus]
MTTTTLPEGNYMIESVDLKGKFLSVENGNICLHAKDPQSVQVWKLTNNGNWVKLQGVPPDAVQEGKVVGADMSTYTLVYGDGIIEEFQLEHDAKDTFRVTLEYYELGLYWYVDDGKSVSFTDNQTYAAKWKLTNCST